MPKLTGSAPVLLVSNVEKSANYWRDAMGFRYEKLWGHPAHFCILDRGPFSLMLAQADPKDIKPHWKIVSNMWNAYFWVDDATALYHEFKAAGAIIDYHLAKKDYGCLEFGVQDLDGHDIAFGERL
ncbi:MAG: putative glyoxalase superfamily protein PhnB [Rhodothermales bacterium]|jgi:uncharacterized glyoxalase superfamily protein PhnB